ncbi:hypothetical protein QTN25_009522 [Entamoeba marina]
MKRLQQDDDCYFCTDSPAFEPRSILVPYTTQMLAIPVKGRLCPLHIQIVPYDHIGGFSDAEGDISKLSLMQLEKEPLFTEITVGDKHTHINVFPIDISLSKTSKKYFMEAINNKLEDDRENKILKIKGIPAISSKTKYVHVEVLDEGILQVIDKNEIDGLFIRTVIAGIMGIDKLNAYSCSKKKTDLGAEMKAFNEIWKTNDSNEGSESGSESKSDNGDSSD